MSDEPTVSLPELEAQNLAEAALLLDHAREKRDAGRLASALDNNLQVWTALRTIADIPDATLTDTARGNLIRLSDFVATSTLTTGVKISDETLDTLINVNLQISEGLLEGAKRSAGI
ncbi:flagellar biosynthesis regulator FlaF [Magnetospirillum molischianum]|uniref:Flagellar protein FlaF n=1 Tax=Magnetospirillum molischianum DSM 120 TaxID=1150626 RepID=H8FUH7_MAGML|nr:flagellar biosynthesis regulator FlaF [Magnetospirillum molischianum]CCG42015.1 conserved hypothetical protein [Magnetospirillum molischianum DSM 120]